MTAIYPRRSLAVQIVNTPIQTIDAIKFIRYPSQTIKRGYITKAIVAGSHCNDNYQVKNALIAQTEHHLSIIWSQFNKLSLLLFNFGFMIYY